MFVLKLTERATETNTRAGEVHTYYIGKDGYVHDHPKEFTCIPWKRKAYAELYAKKDRERKDQYDRNHNQHFWDSEYEIVEV